MANLPYITEFPNKIFSALKMYSRVGAFPLDPTSVVNTKADLESYINETGSYAYPGQVVSVANGTTAAENGVKDYSLYVIRSDRSVQKVGGTIAFETLTAAETWVAENTVAAPAGEIISVLVDGVYELYMIQTDRSLKRASFDAADIPDISWDSLTGKPTSSTTDIDSSVTFSKKFTEGDRLSYNDKELAYVEDITWANLQDIPTEFAPSAHTHGNDDITDLDASKITSGTISIDRLPHGALERCVVVADDDARFALTSDNVQLGDTIKVTATGKMYFIVNAEKLDSEEGYEVYTAGSATSVPWSGVTGTPTTLAGYGITDAVAVTDLVETANVNNAGKVLKVNAEGKLDASITGDAATVGGKAASAFAEAVHDHTTAEVEGLDTELANIKAGTSITALDASKLTGTINKSVLPAEALNNLVKVSSDAERLVLTSAQVQNGDTVIVEATGNMYLVVDDSQLTTEAGYQIYTGSATSVPWTGITGTPTTLAGYGITDAVKSDEVVETATANKILKLNADAKLPASITGDAATVGGKAADAFAEATHSHGDADITDVAWTKLTGTPTTLEGYGITDAVKSDEVVNTATADKILKLNSEAKFDADITGDADTVDGKHASDFAEAVHGHTITEVEGLDTELANIKNGTAITALDASVITSGTISIDRLPHGALERCVVVADDDARLALTTDSVQTGDTVKVTSTGKMYFVTDDSKLNSEDGYIVYTAGSATSVPWSGVTDTPTTLAGYGITDAMSADADVVYNTDVVDVANAENAGKVIKVNADGKLDASITGAATSVPWTGIEGRPEATAEEIDTAVADAKHENREVLDNLAEVDGSLTHNDKAVAYVEDISKFMQVSATEPTDLPVGGFWFEVIE